MGSANWYEFGFGTMRQGIREGCDHGGAQAANVYRVVVHCVDVRGTVVQAVATFQLKAHVEKYVVTGEADAARDGGVPEALLGPLDKYVT